MVVAEYAYLGTDARGRVIVVGTKTKLTEIVAEHVGWGMGASDIHREHPDWPMAVIHSALAYYYDHQSEVDAEMAATLAEVDAIVAAQPRRQPTHAEMEQRLRDRAGTAG